MQNVFTQRSGMRRGTSLIEVLVVLVVLVVGILAISRLFPAGFLSLRAAENNSYAGRLAQGALDVLKQNNASLADGIYMYQADGTFDPNVSPSDLYSFKPDANGFNTSHAFGALNDPYDDINKVRYISNETVTVPAARSGVGYGLYVLNFGPFEPNTLTVIGTLWTAQNGDSRINPSDPSGTATLDIPVDILQPGQQTFLVDLGAGQIALLPAAYPQTFTLTVTKKVSGTQTVTFTVPASNAVTSPYSGSWFNTIGGTALPTVTDAGGASDPWLTAELYRPFTQVTNMTSYTADPYEYALYSGGGPSGTESLAFNPLAGGRIGVSPLQARLSYSTQDWHILHEDCDVPTGGGTIRLALSGLKQVGDTQFDQTLFVGLVPDPIDHYDLMMVDRDTGDFYGINGQGTYTGPDAPQTVDNLDTGAVPDATHRQISYLNGRLTLPASFSGKHLRVFYAGTADWAVAVQKAPKSYTQVSTLAAVGTPSAQTPNQYYLDTGNKRIAFPICDSGKMVQITLGAQPPLSANIPDTTTPGQTVQYVDVSSIYPTSGTPVITVTGLSARAIVIWHERDQWKTRTIDTLLTRIE